jgi:RNA polymerase sigma-70 factor (ECF subfamily)
MRGADPEIVSWVSSEILPYEAELRTKVRRFCRSAEDLDDLIQDVYFRLLKLTSTDHIHDPRGYLFQTARNLIIDQVRRDQIVKIGAMPNMDELIADTQPGPERVTALRSELRWALGVIASLPGRCQDVFRLRKVQGLSQAETAARLGLSENIVEKETMKGMRMISALVAQGPAARPGLSASASGQPSDPETADHVPY